MNIQQVANYFAITPDHIRFLEYEGFIPRIERANIPADFQFEYVQLYNLGGNATSARKELVRSKC